MLVLSLAYTSSSLLRGFKCANNFPHLCSEVKCIAHNPVLQELNHNPLQLLNNSAIWEELRMENGIRHWTHEYRVPKDRYISQEEF